MLPPPRSTLFSLHDALPISHTAMIAATMTTVSHPPSRNFSTSSMSRMPAHTRNPAADRSEEHTSELQSPDHLVCRLLLEKKKKLAVHNHPAHVHVHKFIAPN